MEKVVGEQILPLIPLRDLIVFPQSLRPFIIKRPSSIDSIRTATTTDNHIFLLTQKDASVENPGTKDFFRVGVIGRLEEVLELPDKRLKVAVRGLKRAFFKDLSSDGNIIYARLVPIPVETVSDSEIESLMGQIYRLFDEWVKKQPGPHGIIGLSAVDPANPSDFCDTIASNLDATMEIRQLMLEAIDIKIRLKIVKRVLHGEIEQLNLDQKVNRAVEQQIEKAQKEYFLTEKMKQIKKELGREDGANEIDDLKSKIEKSGMSEEAMEKARQEIGRLELMPPVSAEATVSRSYIEWLLALPWQKETEDRRDIKRAEKILNEDHYGLEKVKERILEYLAVRQIVKNPKGSILCFVGPPGVGKTSVAKSIARALGRKFVRISLGGVHDEAEIKGHRRTYIGAFPGQIIQMARRAGTKNPLFLLDEVDKIGRDYRGDPSSSLLEVLDPEQNHSFLDHYIDAPFDLSKVFFVTTANILDTIPPALLDRMEVISFSGYTLQEKIAIAKGYLITKECKEHGLKPESTIFEDGAIIKIIEGFTREAGVRNLEREMSNVLRKIVHKQVKEHKKRKSPITGNEIPEILGTPRYKDKGTLKEDLVGVATGLAWTQHGGETLLIETTLMPGTGKLTLTGQMGDIMQESAKAALSFLRASSHGIGVPDSIFRNYDVHIHIPEGAVPKDGPSAGIAILSSLISAFTQIPVRHTIAMTGEITLTGMILPVGGIKEKILAAHRQGIIEIVLPKSNEKDLEEIPEDVRKELHIHFVERAQEAIAIILIKDPSASRFVPLLQADEKPIADSIS